MKNIILRLGGLKDSYLFTLYLANKITLREAERIVADRKKREREMLQIKGQNLF